MDRKSASSTLVVLLALCTSTAAPRVVRAQGAAWDSVARILKTTDAFSSGYHRYNLPRRDLTLRIGDVTVAPELALGAWAGLSGEPDHATMMGDLVVTAGELRPVLAELARQKLAVTAIHNHLVAETPEIVYVHFHGEDRATDLAARLDRVIALTATPRPVAAPRPESLTIDSTAVFRALGRSGRARGAIAQVAFILVPGVVSMHGHPIVPALGYGSPINVQMVTPSRAVATGDFALTGAQVEGVLQAFAAHGILVTAVHSHMIDESPHVYFVHFWADGPLADVLTGLRAALDATH